MEYRLGDSIQKEIAFCGLFGALGLVLPFLFHLIGLGKIFLPMYLPLICLSFFVSPKFSGITAFVVPFISFLFTGMPPIYPPVVFAMAFEISFMAMVISFFWKRSHKNIYLILILTLLGGRVFQFCFGYLLGIFLNLPPKFLSVYSLAMGFPGIILILVVTPPLIKLLENRL